ncbi:FAD/FMN_dependent oxidoreductase [Hexamita inflata]|uniref:FAD/FMN dependent oxidoreductase n=1 Tax=Hexamita inflata TaxID=28002 RepID=A0AA86V0L6_9EUKA|nr:FAD/FMN dependent oxidoreductase [Hexamita inflata]
MFTKYKIANFEVENRSVRSATATGTCTLQTGIPEQKFYEFYESLARGHVGLLIQENAFVAIRGQHGSRRLGIHTDEMIQYHRKANEIMRAANDKIRICCQLTHAGPNGNANNKLQINEATAADFEEVVQQFKITVDTLEEQNIDKYEIQLSMFMRQFPTQQIFCRAIFLERQNQFLQFQPLYLKK